MKTFTEKLWKKKGKDLAIKIGVVQNIRNLCLTSPNSEAIFNTSNVSFEFDQMTSAVRKRVIPRSTSPCPDRCSVCLHYKWRFWWNPHVVRDALMSCERKRDEWEW